MSWSWQNPAAGPTRTQSLSCGGNGSDGIPLAMSLNDQLPNAFAGNMNDAPVCTPTKRHGLESSIEGMSMTLSESKTKKKKENQCSGKERKGGKGGRASDPTVESCGLGEKHAMRCMRLTYDGSPRKPRGKPTLWHSFVKDNFSSAPAGTMKSKMAYLSNLWKAGKTDEALDITDATESRTGELPALTSTATEQLL